MMAKTKAHQVYKLKNGTRVPGVTTALGVLSKPALIPWAWGLGMKGIDYRKFRDDKADIGTLAHYLIMCHLKKQEPDTSDYSKAQIDQAENCVLSYYEWENSHPFEPILVETPLVSEVHKFGGTPDLLANGNGGGYLIDLKTGKAIYDDFLFQLAAYKILLEENGHPVEKARILRIGRSEDESFEDRLVGDLEPQKKLFLHCLEIYRLKKEIKKGG